MYNDILLAVDLNDESSWNRTLPLAIEYCRSFGSRLHVLTVVPDFGMSIVGQYFPKGYEKKVADEIMQKLRDFVDEMVPEGIRVRHVVGEGTVYEVILSVANRVGADLIVVSAGRPELKDYLLGPNAARVVRHANCSVLVVRG